MIWQASTKALFFTNHADGQAPTFEILQKARQFADLANTSEAEVQTHITKPLRIVTRPENAFSGLVEFPLTISVNLSGSMTTWGSVLPAMAAASQLRVEGAIEKSGPLSAFVDDRQGPLSWIAYAGHNVAHLRTKRMFDGSQSVTWTSVSSTEVNKATDRVQCSPYEMWQFTFTGRFSAAIEAGVAGGVADIVWKGWSIQAGAFSIYRKL
jgi:hypothetical protein